MGTAWVVWADQAFLGWWRVSVAPGRPWSGPSWSLTWGWWSVQVVACTFQPPSWCKPRPSSRDRLTAATRKLSHSWLRVTPR